MILSYLIQLFNWFTPVTSEEDDTWEIILSTAEQFIQTNLHEARSELTLISQHGQLKKRHSLQQQASHYLAQLGEVDRGILLDSRLDSSKRNHIFRRAIQTHQQLWFQQLSSCVLIDPKMWEEVPYQKNLLGELQTLTFQMSGPAQGQGLTGRILGDVIWSLYLGLMKGIPELGPDHNQVVEQILEQFLQTVVQLWIETTQIVGDIATREGHLPHQWKGQFKEQPPIAARFNDPIVDPVPSGTIDQRRKQLEKSLLFRKLVFPT